VQARFVETGEGLKVFDSLEELLKSKEKENR